MQLDAIFKMAISDSPKMCFSPLKFQKIVVFVQMIMKSKIFKKKTENMLNSPISTSGVPNFNFLA